MGWTKKGVGVWFPAEINIFLLSIASRYSPGSTQSPTKWIRFFFSPGVQQARRKIYHWLPFRTEERNAWSYRPINFPYGLTVSYAIKFRENFAGFFIYVFRRLSEPQSRHGLDDEEGSCFLLRKPTPIIWAVGSNLLRGLSCLATYGNTCGSVSLLCSAEHSRFQLRSTPYT
jgi:hypothetical protein